MRRSLLLALLAWSGCAARYAYTFSAAAPAGDADVAAAITVDARADAVDLELTNRTDQVVQVEWPQLTIARGDGTTASLRPDADLGWIQPGATASAHLVPLVLPRKGDAAAAYEGRHFDIAVPMIVRREAKLYHYSLVAHVHEI